MKGHLITIGIMVSLVAVFTAALIIKEFAAIIGLALGIVGVCFVIAVLYALIHSMVTGHRNY